MARTAPAIIKKYGNRRLYDTSASRYVNLEEIAALVRNGTEVRVLDAKTGEDLTRVVLTQIIVEDAKGSPAGLPLDVLRHIIMASDQAGRELLGWYLKSAFESYQKVQGVLQSGLATAARSPLEMMRGFFGGEKNEVEELRQRVAELEARVEKPRSKRKGISRRS